MGWATAYIQKLRDGETVQFRPRGNSMSGRVESGQLVTVEPVTDTHALRPGDIVLCKVQGREYLHLVQKVGQDGQVLIGNNRGHTNGWTRTVYGKCVKVEA